MKELVLYIGGFEVPDRNAAAQRVVGIAKSLRQLGYEVTFLNVLKTDIKKRGERREYFGFSCVEYSKETEFDYLFRHILPAKRSSKLSSKNILHFSFFPPIIL